MRNIPSVLAAAALVCAALSARTSEGAIREMSPSGETVSLLPSAQKEILAIEGNAARRDALRAWRHEKKHEHVWRKPAPLEFAWKTDPGEGAPWRVRIAREESMEGADVFWLSARVVKAVSSNAEEVVWKCEIPRPNLDIGAKYWWDVAANVRCKNPAKCGCASGKPCECGGCCAVKSPAVSFSTEDLPPRWIKIEGRVDNIRDLGGWKTADGGRVRTGMAFRGQGLNDNSTGGCEPGRNRLTIEDAAYLKGRLGIKTDLDLRSEGETAGMASSPLGDGVKFIQHSSPAYGGIFASHGKKTMAENFRVMCDRANYPIYFHCIGGADRTGALAYVLNGLLGVAKEDLERDWESTFYPNIPGFKKTDWQGSHYFDEGFAKYGGEGDSLQERIRLYLLDCGVTQEEMDAYRAIMFESGR